MESDSEKHHRRSIRLKGYDYSRSGAYFITICTQKRMCLFGDIVDGIMAFNEAGRMIKRTFEQMPAKYTGVQTDVFVVMPNHLHGIIKIENTSSVGAAPRGRPLSLSNETANCLTDDIDKGQIDKKRMSLSDIVHRFKSFTTYLYSKGAKEQGWVPFPGRLWQRNYYERIIRGNDEMSKIREYIENNPCTWDEDEENPYKIGKSQ